MVSVVEVGPFPVPDRSRGEVISAILELASAGRGLAVGLHVAALNARHDEGFAEVVRAADVVFADGSAVAVLARVAGGRNVERAPTTDIGHEVLALLSESLGRPARVALVGGPEGVAERAGEILAARHGCVPVLTESGFRDDWDELGDRVAASGADLLLLGLGLPLEATTAMSIRDRTGCPIYGVGGWFGHVIGHESRAPAALRRVGLEWMWRMAQQPRRLVPRYVRGLVSTLSLVPSALRSRWRGGDRA